MPLDFDPVFHTETMVKILREQGSTQYAMELAELILQKNPQHEGVRRILEELREEARRAFERFKSGGRPPDAAAPSDSGEAAPSEPTGGEEEPAVAEFPAVPASVPEAEASAEVAFVAAPPSGPADEALVELAAELPEAGEAPPEADGSAAEPVRLTLVPPPPPPTRRESKILRLQSLLRRVQSLRRAAHAPQA